MATQEMTGCSALDTSPVQNITAALDCNNSNTNNTIARRSLSIFSRRGTATPTPSVSRMPSVVFNSRPSVRRQSSKMFRSKKQPAPIPEGTILKAVPPATQDVRPPMARSMSTLELEMAFSPNEEILTAIRSPTIQASPITPRTPYSATSSLDRLAKKRSQTFRVPTKRNRATVDCIPEGMIGVWKDGQTQWVQGTSSPTPGSASARPVSTPAPDRTVKPARTGRPQIRVIIPSHRLNAPLPSLPFFAAASQSNRSPSTSTSSTLVASDAQEPHPPRRSSLRPAARQTTQRRQAHRPRRSTSSSDSSSNADDEDNSNYSRSSRSSITSVESDTANNQYQFISKRLRERSGSQAFSIVTPAAAGVYDDASVFTTSPRPRSPSVAELPGSSPSDKRTVSRTSSHSSPLRRHSTRRMSSRRGTWLLSAPPRRSRDIARPESMSLSDAEIELENTLTSIENGTISRSSTDAMLTVGFAELAAEPVVPHSPPPIPAKSTRRLTVTYRQSKGAAVVPAVEMPMAARAIAGRAKTIRERRRESKSREKRPEYNTRSHSMPEVERISIAELPEFEEDAWQEARAAAQREITAYQAECVIKRIMESLATLKDLHNTAILNKGFYGVYKRNEMHLLWAVLKNTSPAMWEFMQSAQSSPILEHEDKVVVDAVAFTPSSFMATLTKSQGVVENLKKLMHATCRSYLRPCTFDGLVDSGSPASARIDAALWRIWTFCCIFGSNKGREDDMLGQKDWLNGGALVHQQSCTSTIVSSDSFAMSEVLLNASEHFGRGNGVDGLGAEELYDMTELWNCMKWLVEGLEGQTEQARQHGVFDHTDVRGGDIDGEEAMLEEYTSYLLTLGLEPVLIVASALHLGGEATPDQPTKSARPFALAKNNGWMSWTVPPPGASRCNFLKESLTRTYEERIQSRLSDSERQAADAKKEELKEVRRQRGQSYAQEIMRSRQNIANEPKPQFLRPLGLIDERPMSDWELVLTKLANGQAAGQNSSAATSSDHLPRSASPEQCDQRSIASDARSTSDLPERVATPPQPAYNKEYGPSLSSCPSSPRMQHSRTGSTPSGRSHSPVSPTTSLSDIHPAFRSEVAASRAKTRSDVSSASSAASSSPKPRQAVTFAPHPLQLKLAEDLEEDIAMDTAGRAVSRIVEMGFTSEQASHALMKTDLGDGLNVDNAVEFLLQTQAEL